MYDLVLFDLDGTLLDTSRGIFNSVRYAEEKMGFKRINDAQLKAFVGPPPKKMYMDIYGVDEETALAAAKYHREYGRNKAIFEAEVYPGIPDLLMHLKASGVKKGVATLKGQKIAEAILAEFGLLTYFDVVVGMDSQESLTKEDTIRLAMAQTNSTNCLMVGDSEYDYQGACDASVDFIGVLYGFGFQPGKHYDFKSASSPQMIEKLTGIKE